MVKRKQVNKSVPEWIADLGLQSTYARKNAIIHLAEKKSHQAVEPLEGMCQGPDAALRACAGWALGEIGAKKSLKTLEKLTKDMDTEVRRSAVRALWTLLDPTSETALKAAVMDSDKWVAQWASKALVSLAESKDDKGISKAKSVKEAKILELKA